MNFYKRLENEISFYLNNKIEISDGVDFSQHDTIQRIMKFKNRDLAGTKIDEDLRYLYHFDIISPRVNNEVKNLRLDTKHIMPYSENPREDFPPVFIMEAKLRDWMQETGEAKDLKKAIDEFVANGNVGFKKTEDGFERVDPTNTYITNQTAETVEETDIIERHEMSASEVKEMEENGWENVDEVIRKHGNKSFQTNEETTDEETTKEYYELYEFTGEVSEKEFKELQGEKGGDEDKYFLAKVIVSGLSRSGEGDKITVFAESLEGDDMTDWYRYAHRGKYEGRFWRVGMYELLFDHQVRANEIGRQIAAGLEWASKIIFRSSDSSILQNIRSDLTNGDIIISDDLQQVDVRLRNLDQLINDWNRLIKDADSLANSHEVARGESLPSGTPFRLGALLDENTNKYFKFLRQKFAIVYREVFEEWVMPKMVEELSGEEIFRLTGNTEMLDRFRKVAVDSWYMNNLVKIGPHTKEEAKAIKNEKMEELKEADPVIENTDEIWDGVLERLHITIVGENKDVSGQLETIANLIQLEDDPQRRAFLLNSIYKMKGIPVPPKEDQQQRQQRSPNQGGGRQLEEGGEGQAMQGGGSAMEDLKSMMGEGGMPGEGNPQGEQ